MKFTITQEDAKAEDIGISVHTERPECWRYMVEVATSDVSCTVAVCEYETAICIRDEIEGWIDRAGDGFRSLEISDSVEANNGRKILRIEVVTSEGAWTRDWVIGGKRIENATNPLIRDGEDSCKEYEPGTPGRGDCMGDGHYLCRACTNFDATKHLEGHE